MAASTASRCTEKTRSKSFDLTYPLALALKHDELDERGHLVEPAEGPDEKDDRDRYADQPKQKTSTHNFLLLVAPQPNVGSELKFRARSQTGSARRVRTPTGNTAGRYAGVR